MGIDTKQILGQLSNARRVTNTIRGGVLSDPQRSYMWEFRVSGQELGGTFLNDLRFYAKTLSIPNYSVEPINIRYVGNQITYPGADNSSHQFTVNFYDDEQLTVLGYFRQWMELLREVKTGRAVGKRNATGSTISIKLKDHSDLVTTGEIVFTNAFPIEIGEVNLSYDSSEFIEIPITFVFDESEVVK